MGFSKEKKKYADNRHEHLNYFPQWKEISEMIKYEMESAIQLIVPLKVEFGYGESWYDAH